MWSGRIGPWQALMVRRRWWRATEALSVCFGWLGMERASRALWMLGWRRQVVRVPKSEESITARDIRECNERWENGTRLRAVGRPRAGR